MAGRFRRSRRRPEAADRITEPLAWSPPPRPAASLTDSESAAAGTRDVARGMMINRLS